MHQDEGGEMDPTQAIDWTPSFGICSNRSCTTRATTPVVSPGISSVSPTPLNRINTNRSPLILNSNNVTRGGSICAPRVTGQTMQARLGLRIMSNPSIQLAPSIDGPRLQNPQNEHTYVRNHNRGYNNQQQHQQPQMQQQQHQQPQIQQQQQLHHHQQQQQQQVSQNFATNIPTSSYLQPSQYSNMSLQERNQISQLGQQLLQDCSYNTPPTQVQPLQIQQTDYHQVNLLPQPNYQLNQMPQYQIQDYQQPRRSAPTQPANTNILTNNYQPIHAPMLTQQLLQNFNPNQAFSSQSAPQNRPNLSFHPTPPIQTTPSQFNTTQRGRRRAASNIIREPASNEPRTNSTHATNNTQLTENRSLITTQTSTVPVSQVNLINQQTEASVEQQTVANANVNAGQQQAQSTPVSVSSTTRSSNEQQSRANVETNTPVEKCNKACQVDIRPIMVSKALMVCTSASVVDQGCQTDPIVDEPKEKKEFVDQATMPLFSPMLVRFKTTPKRRKLNPQTSHDQSDDDDEIDVTR